MKIVSLLEKEAYYILIKYPRTLFMPNYSSRQNIYQEFPKESIHCEYYQIICQHSTRTVFILFNPIINQEHYSRQLLSKILLINLILKIPYTYYKYNDAMLSLNSFPSYLSYYQEDGCLISFFSQPSYYSERIYKLGSVK